MNEHNGSSVQSMRICELHSERSGHVMTVKKQLISAYEKNHSYFVGRIPRVL